MHDESEHEAVIYRYLPISRTQPSLSRTVQYYCRCVWKSCCACRSLSFRANLSGLTVSPRSVIGPARHEPNTYWVNEVDLLESIAKNDVKDALRLRHERVMNDL